MFLRKVTPACAVLVCACLGATLAPAQEGPTEEELESARMRLQQALEASGLPPAAFEADPIPDWAVPHHEPKVLSVPGAGLQPDIPAQGDAREIATPAEPPPQDDPPPVAATKKSEPEKPKSAEKPKPKPKPEKPAVARKKETPKLKSGRAVADDAQKPEQKPQQPAAPNIALPERLRP